MTIFERISHWRIRLSRLGGYLFILSFPSTILTVLKVYGFSGWWGLAMVPVVVLILWFDDRHGMKGETDYSNERNKAINEILDYIRRKP